MFATNSYEGNTVNLNPIYSAIHTINTVIGTINTSLTAINQSLTQLTYNTEAIYNSLSASHYWIDVTNFRISDNIYNASGVLSGVSFQNKNLAYLFAPYASISSCTFNNVFDNVYDVGMMSANSFYGYTNLNVRAKSFHSNTVSRFMNVTNNFNLGKSNSYEDIQNLLLMGHHAEITIGKASNLSLNGSVSKINITGHVHNLYYNGRYTADYYNNNGLSILTNTNVDNFWILDTTFLYSNTLTYTIIDTLASTVGTNTPWGVNNNPYSKYRY